MLEKSEDYRRGLWKERKRMKGRKKWRKDLHWCLSYDGRKKDQMEEKRREGVKGRRRGWNDRYLLSQSL